LAKGLPKLRGVKGFEVAFVFGSLASAAGKAASDVDLFVIGDARLRTLAPALRKAADPVGREIIPVSMTASEFWRRRAKKDLVPDVLGKEKLLVKGGPDDLEQLG
jgi:predicted nucleotidyltransferase